MKKGNRILGPIRQRMDERFRENEDRLTEAWRNRDTQTIWKIWGKCVEAAVENKEGGREEEAKRPLRK